MDSRRTGSLVIVGCGIKLAAHMTLESKAYIENSNRCFYLVNDPAMEEWLLMLNPNAKSLQYLYTGSGLRINIYKNISSEILNHVRKGEDVCVVFYGHPGVFVYSSHGAVNQALKEGYEAKLIPGISADACLISDIGFDPGQSGCQSYEATDFLLYNRQYDPHSHLILWQIGGIGNLYLSDNNKQQKENLEILMHRLQLKYNQNHEVIIYEAALYPGFDPVINRIKLCELPQTCLTRISTLYVPPIQQNNVDREMAQKLGIPEILGVASDKDTN